MQEEPVAAETTKPSKIQNDNLPNGERTPYEEVQQRIGQAGINEYWVLKAIKRPGWVPEHTPRLADLGDKGLRVLLVRWSNALEAAREEEASIQQPEQAS